VSDYLYAVFREITPIIARDIDHAYRLLWRQHGEYLTEFFGHPLQWANQLNERTKQYLLLNTKMVELQTANLWSTGYFISNNISTPIG
jgi:hypothetical protein